MNLLDLFSLQGTLFALMIVGAILKKKEIIDANDGFMHQRGDPM